MRGISEGKWVRLKPSSQWPENYVSFEEQAVEVLKIMPLEEVSHKPLLKNTDGNRKVAVLKAMVESAHVHHNGNLVVDVKDLSLVNFFERFKIKLNA